MPKLKQDVTRENAHLFYQQEGDSSVESACYHLQDAIKWLNYAAATCKSTDFARIRLLALAEQIETGAYAEVYAAILTGEDVARTSPTA